MVDVYLFTGQVTEQYNSLSRQQSAFCGWENTRCMIDRLEKQAQWNSHLQTTLKKLKTLDKLVYDLVIERCNLYLFEEEKGCHHSCCYATLFMFSEPVVGCTFGATGNTCEELLVASTFDIHKLFTELWHCGFLKRYIAKKIMYENEKPQLAPGLDSVK